MIQETFDIIRQHANQAGFTDRTRLNIETDSDLENCYSQAYTPTLFGNKRILEVHYTANKLTTAGKEFLQYYTQHPETHTLMIIKLPKIDSKTEQTKWFKAIEKNSIVIPIWPLSPKQLLAWIMARAKTNKLQLLPDAAQLLALYVEGNCHAAAQEIEKLSLLDQPIIDSQTVKNFVVDQGCFTTFDLVENSLAQNAKQTLRILEYLRKEGTEPLVILGTYLYELRTITKLAKEFKTGASLATLFQKYYVRAHRQNITREFLKRCTYDQCLDLLSQAATIDRVAKGASPGDIWEVLREFTLYVLVVI